MTKETFSFNMERYIAKNWKYLFWSIIILFFCVTAFFYEAMKEISLMRQELSKNITSVVMTTVDGRAIKVEKSPIEAKFLEKHIGYMLANSLIVDRAELTDNFKIDHITDWKDLLQHSQHKLKLFLLNYIDNKDAEAVGQFLGYVKYLLAAIPQDKLPEYISTLGYDITQFTFKNNSFEIKEEVRVATLNYDIATQKYIKKQGVVTIAASGDFDLALSNDLNPYGLRFKTLKMGMVKK